MRFILRICFIIALIYCIFYCIDLASDNAQLKSGLIRMHVVANSDSPEDQSVKIQVKDAIVDYLQPILEKMENKEEAQQYIRENLSQLQEKANEILQDMGEDIKATVSLTREYFEKREYDTFSLPSGVYDALRIEIGEGEGKNWWCVAFPSLCMPKTETAFEASAVSSGFTQTLSETLAKNNEYEIRFFLLDLLGKGEKFFKRPVFWTDPVVK